METSRVLLKKPGSKNWIYRTMVNGKTWERSTGESAERKAQAKVPELVALAQMHRTQPSDCLRLKDAIVKEVDIITKDVSEREGARVDEGLGRFFAFVGKDIALEKINTGLLEQYQRERLQKASLSTYKKESCYIARMLRRNGFHVEKPKPKRGSVTKHRPFTQEELKAFFSNCVYAHWVLFMTMLVTGARTAELIPSPRSQHKPLLKSELNVQAGRMTIRNAKLKPNEPDRFRVASIPVWLMEELKSIAAKTPGAFVFPTRKRGLAYFFDEILKRAGIAKADPLGRKLTAHSLRHTFCNSLAASVGNNPFAVMGQMGHSNISTTQIYCHGATEVIDLQALIETRPRVIKKKFPHTLKPLLGSGMGKTYGEVHCK